MFWWRIFIFLVSPFLWIQVELRDHDHTVECIAWAPDNAAGVINEAAGSDNKTGAHQGPFLASGSRDKSIRVSSACVWRIQDDSKFNVIIPRFRYGTSQLAYV